MTFNVFGNVLGKVRIQRELHTDITYSRFLWDQMFKHASSLEHPTKSSHPTVLNMGIKFRYVREPWSTFGQMKFTFYCAEDRQVRARIRYASSLAKLENGQESEISFHLDESQSVVPALFHSLNDLSFTHLKATGLFEEGLSDSPLQPCKCWTAKGRAASEWRRGAPRSK